MSKPWDQESVLCVGLDSEISKLPKRWQSKDEPQLSFNQWVIDQTADFVGAYKLNTAFYEARLADGWREMAKTIAFLRAEYSEKLVIVDAKRADIGSTSQAYATALFDQLGADAVTLSPYLGSDALEPFLSRTDKFSIILCKTSNPGSAEFQDKLVTLSTEQEKSFFGNQQESVPLWQHVAYQVSQHWNQHNNCMLVVGATYPSQLHSVRQLVGDMPILVPGLGAQGGDLVLVLQAGCTKTGGGLLLSVSRDVIFAADPRSKAEEWNMAINGNQMSDSLQGTVTLSSKQLKNARQAFSTQWVRET